MKTQYTPNMNTQYEAEMKIRSTHTCHRNTPNRHKEKPRGILRKPQSKNRLRNNKFLKCKNINNITRPPTETEQKRKKC